MKNKVEDRLLLVEDDAAVAERIQTALESAKSGPFDVLCVTNLADALAQLLAAEFAAVLLDLSLPDSQGMGVFEQTRAAAPDALIMILTTESDEDSACQAVQQGAEDYFFKARIDAHWFPRALRHAIERGAARDALRRGEALFRAMSDASPLGIFVSDARGECVYTNAAYQQISGMTLQQTLGNNWSMAIHQEDRERVLAEWRMAAHGRVPFKSEFRFLQGGDRVVWTRVNSAVMADADKSFGLVQTVEDISERKATEDALFEEQVRAQVTLDAIGDAVVTTDILGNVTFVNLVAEAMTGWPRATAMGRPLTEVFNIIDGKTRAIAVNPALRAIAENRTLGLAMDSVLIRRDGSETAIEDSAAPIHNRDGQVTGAVLVFHDVSESREMALKMAHLAQHDFLTGLPNRMLLTERLARAIGLANRHQKQVALLYLDLDDFKHVNDSLGHAIGDLLLQSIAERLKAGVRVTDTVCRQGGDEFVILLAEIEHPQDAGRVADTLLASLALPHMINGHELHATVSIGISVYPNDGVDLDAVLQNADTAMFHAKSCGRNNYQFFQTDMNTRAVRRQFVESSLRRALKHDEFLLHYQPQIDLVSKRMIGVEALIRWRDPELGLVYPAQFVPIAQECGLIVPVGRWVLREACRQTRAWLDAGLAAVPVAVNISALEFRQPGFLEGVTQILKETGLAPCYLELELTESILMHDADASILVLQGLKAMGVKIALDDFGTGYSSLSYLERFPIDTLKIDQSFVRDITSDTGSATIVSAVIGMGKNLKQRVIAEGVETENQLDFLLARQCDEGQGFLFSHPLSAENFARLLANRGE